IGADVALQQVTQVLGAKHDFPPVFERAGIAPSVNVNVDARILAFFWNCSLRGCASFDPPAAIVGPQPVVISVSRVDRSVDERAMRKPPKRLPREDSDKEMLNNERCSPEWRTGH